MGKFKDAKRISQVNTHHFTDKKYDQYIFNS